MLQYIQPGRMIRLKIYIHHVNHSQADQPQGTAVMQLGMCEDSKNYALPAQRTQIKNFITCRERKEKLTLCQVNW